MAREQQEIVYEQQNKKRSMVLGAGQDKQPQILLPAQLQAIHIVQESLTGSTMATCES